MIGNEEYLCKQIKTLADALQVEAHRGDDMQATITSWKTEAELRYAEVGRLKITITELTEQLKKSRTMHRRSCEETLRLREDAITEVRSTFESDAIEAWKKANAELQAKIDELEGKIDNANMAAAETARDWESRCYSIMTALGEDYE